MAVVAPIEIEVQTVEIEADRIRLKVGTLDVDVTAGCYGKVEIDGKPLSCCKLTVELEVGEMAKVTAVLVPM